jgi:hypothetical protein
MCAVCDELVSNPVPHLDRVPAACCCCCPCCLRQAVNRSESASDDSREAEKRLKDLLAGETWGFFLGGGCLPAQ